MYLIFDFDGTLVDSYSKVIEIYNDMAMSLRIRSINSEEKETLRHLNTRELIQYLCIPAYKLPVVIYKARQNMRKDMLHLKPFNDMPEVLDELNRAGYQFGIVSSNSEDNIKLWLHHHDLARYFSFIHSSSNIFGKKRVLEKMLKMNQDILSPVFYIGDETRDIEAALGSGITSIAVTWGFNSEKILVQYKPHFIVRNPRDLLSLLL